MEEKLLHGWPLLGGLQVNSDVQRTFYETTSRSFDFVELKGEYLPPGGPPLRVAAFGSRYTTLVALLVSNGEDGLQFL